MKHKWIEPDFRKKPETSETEPTPIVAEPEVVFTTAKVGTVVNCSHLNIREDPDPNAKIIGIVPSGTELDIDAEKTTETFYAVNYEGLDGFCMRQYIEEKK